LSDTSGKFEPNSGEPQFQVIGICGSCVWQRVNPFKCKAFPDGIPKEILFGDVMHTEPYRRGGQDDHGIVFRRKGPQGPT
jgi:hypothetical protein